MANIAAPMVARNMEAMRTARIESAVIIIVSSVLPFGIADYLYAPLSTGMNLIW